MYMSDMHRHNIYLTFKFLLVKFSLPFQCTFFDSHYAAPIRVIRILPQQTKQVMTHPYVNYSADIFVAQQNTQSSHESNKSNYFVILSFHQLKY